MFNCTVFSTAKNTYLFDGISGNILYVDEDKVDNIRAFCSDGDISGTDIPHAINDRLIIAAPDVDLPYWFDEDKYYDTLFDEISHLMINVTDSCNMRCKYCVYGGNYKNERVHGCGKIEADTIKKIIDRFLQLTNNNKLIFNFYGGEPFLCFSEIEKSVSYINRTTNNSQIYITTNGTLLNEQVCRWFADTSNVHIYISIAGVPSIHDKLRVFANGSPTFDVISDNLKRLRSFNPKAYKERVHFIFNLFDESQLIELQSFWSEHEIFSEVMDLPEVTFIDCVDDNGKVKNLSYEISQIYSSEKSPLEEYIRLLSSNDHDNIIVKHYDDKFLRIHNRSSDTNPSLSGVCRPFIKKMFVDTSGKVHLCENFTFGEKFGSIFDTFPIDQTKELLTSYKEYRQTACSKCWANKLCSLCFRDVFDRDGSIDPVRASEICETEKSIVLNTLSEYCTVMEVSPTLMNHLDGYEVYV